MRGGISSHQRQSKASKGKQQQSMAINSHHQRTSISPPQLSSNRWQSMAINGNRWQSMAINGNQWQSKAISAPPSRRRAGSGPSPMHAPHQPPGAPTAGFHRPVAGRASAWALSVWQPRAPRRLPIEAKPVGNGCARRGEQGVARRGEHLHARLPMEAKPDEGAISSHQRPIRAIKGNQG